MKEAWYGDKRDLLKWSAVLHICERHNLEAVLHVAMQTNSSPHEFTINGERCPVTESVWQHFRSLRNIERLFGTTKLQVVDEAFTHKDRQRYFERVFQALKSLEGRKLVLLDPDTGLAPQSTSEKHIRAEECQAIWNALEAGDALLLYQHSWREPEWKRKATARFRDLLGTSELIRAESPEFATDVILLGAVKHAPVE